MLNEDEAESLIYRYYASGVKAEFIRLLTFPDWAHRIRAYCSMTQHSVESMRAISMVDQILLNHELIEPDDTDVALIMSDFELPLSDQRQHALRRILETRVVAESEGQRYERLRRLIAASDLGGLRPVAIYGAISQLLGSIDDEEEQEPLLDNAAALQSRIRDGR